jgi:hypothetical protein
MSNSLDRMKRAPVPKGTTARSTNDRRTTPSHQKGHQALTLTRDETLTAYHCVAAVIRGFNTAPPPWAVRHLYDLLNTELRNPSHSGPQCCCGEEQSVSETLISSRQAAEVLGYSKRHVNRIAESLGGHLVDGSRVFRLSQVLDYAQGRDARPGTGHRAEAS